MLDESDVAFKLHPLPAKITLFIRDALKVFQCRSVKHMGRLLEFYLLAATVVTSG